MKIYLILLFVSCVNCFNFLKLCSNNKLFKKNNKNTVAKYKHLMLKYNLDKKGQISWVLIKKIVHLG